MAIPRASTDEQEWMDDFSIRDHRLERALHDLQGVGRWLGGYATLREGLQPFLRHRRLRLLDLGSGLADAPAHLVRWADGYGVELHVVALEANDATADYARAFLDDTLPPRLRPRVTVMEGDVFDLPFERNRFDVVTASLFLHHFFDQEAVELLRTMDRLARRGVVVSDLHRHPLALAGVRAVSQVLPVSPMFAHDGPLSVRRGFTRDELLGLARAAGLVRPNLRWRWAFRWLLTSHQPDRS